VASAGSSALKHLTPGDPLGPLAETDSGDASSAKVPVAKSTMHSCIAPAVGTAIAPSALPAAGAPTRLPEHEVEKQKRFGAQSCRGIGGKPDLSPLRCDSHALALFREMLARERAHAGDWTVFYHSYNSPALIYEVQAAVAKILFRFGAKHGSLPRLLKKPFDTLPDADAMLKAFPSWPDQDHNAAFKATGICVTTSLVSPDPEATPTQVFLMGYAASSVSIHVLEKLLRDCGAGLGRKSDVSHLARKVMDLAKEFGLPQATGAGLMGHLLQIFVRRTCVDRWAYASHPMGVPDKARQPLSKALAQPGTIAGQARMVVNPSAFMRASSVRLYACSADATFHRNRTAFQEALGELLNPILGTPDVRERAAKGIYGGELPSWWRDLSSEIAESDGHAPSIGPVADSVDASTHTPKTGADSLAVVSDVLADAASAEASILEGTSALASDAAQGISVDDRMHSERVTPKHEGSPTGDSLRGRRGRKQGKKASKPAVEAAAGA